MSVTIPQVTDFANADPTDKALLGGKGAGLAAMTAAGLPVPAGFIVTTAACSAYYDTEGVISASLWDQVERAVAGLENETGKAFGDLSRPLLVSVRSGAPVSMPGMMDTVLNLGLNDATADALGELTGDPDFSWDCYRRFIQMYGEIAWCRRRHSPRRQGPRSDAIGSTKRRGIARTRPRSATKHLHPNRTHRAG